MNHTKRRIQIVRWVARIWSILLIGFGLLQVIEPDVTRPVPWHEWVGPILLFSGVVIGFALSWQWERAGGMVMICCHLGAIIAASLSSGKLMQVSVIFTLVLLFTTPGVLFLLANYLDRREQVNRSLLPTS